MLASEPMAQVITEFDLAKNTFSYIDRDDLGLDRAALAKLVVEKGLAFKTKGNDANTESLNWHVKNGVCLSADRKLICLTGATVNVDHIGKPFLLTKLQASDSTTISTSVSPRDSWTAA